MACYIPEELRKAKPMAGKERLGAERDSEYMGAEDLDPGSEPILTIDHIYHAQVTLQRGRELKDVMTFREESVPGIKRVRPLIVNATNRKTLRKLFKAVTAESLEGKAIQLYLDPNVRDPSTGDRIDGIRIKPKAPTVKAAEPIICTECGKPISGFGRYSPEDIAARAISQYGRAICIDCGKKLADKTEPDVELPAENETEE